LASWQSPATNLDGVRIVASADAIALVRSLGGRLWVWPSRSAGCQPITMLHTSVAPVAGRTFHRAEFDPIELNLALASRWPQELELVERRGKVCGLVGRQQVGDLRALLLPSPEAATGFGSGRSGVHQRSGPAGQRRARGACRSANEQVQTQGARSAAGRRVSSGEQP